MTAALWLMFRTSSMRWITPVSACGCTLLVAGNLVEPSDTSMQASSEAALSIMVWAPAMLLASFSSTQSAGLFRTDDVLVLPTWWASRLARILSVVGAQLAWAMLGWIGLWAGCNVLASRNGTPLYWSMAMNGVAVTGMTTVVGALLAVHRSPAWVAAISSAGSYVALAIWSYIPDLAVSVLFSPYDPLFLIEGLPNRNYLEIQLLWDTAVVLIFLAWSARVLATPPAVALVLAAAVATSATSANMSWVVARSGALRLACAPHHGIEVCLWADHEGQRPRIEEEVDLARTLLGPTWRPEFVSEGDLESGPPAALPPGAIVSNTALIPTSANPVRREAAARMVAAALHPPAGCPGLATPSELGEPVGSAIERLVLLQQEGSSGRISDRELVTRLALARREISLCQSPDLR